MSDTNGASKTQGRVIRAALVILPAGLIVSGVLSFGIWWWKRNQAEERSYKFASAMRRDLNETEIARYVSILSDVLTQPEERRLPAVAAFMDSSMGAENMGYQVRRDFFQSGPAELANVDVELTGKQRPREIVLVLAPYGEPALVKQEAHALAELMSLAHALTGENRTITLRFAGIPMGVRDPDGKIPIERFATVCRGRDERMMKVFVLGGRPEAELAEIRSALQTEAQGTILQTLPATTETHATLGAAAALKTTLMAAIE